MGLLNTDWGDSGHVNLLGCSYHGLALGAAAGWNCKAASDLDSFDRAFSAIEFGDFSNRIISAWRTMNNAVVFCYDHVFPQFDPGIPEEDKQRLLEEYRKIKPATAGKYLKTAAEAEKQFMETAARCDFLDPLAREEILCGLRGEILMHEIMCTILRYKGFEPWETADKLRAFEVRFSALWHKRNKPSEYYRLREEMMQIADYLDRLNA